MNLDCRTISIGGSALGGLLIALLLAAGERGLFTSLLIGAALAVAAGFLLLAYVCTGEDAAAGGESGTTPETARIDEAETPPAPFATPTAEPEHRAAESEGDAAARRDAPDTAEATPERPAEAGVPSERAMARPVNGATVLDEAGSDEVEQEDADLGDEVSGITHHETAAAGDVDMPDAVAADAQRAPKLLEAPRGGAGDDLKQLRGVGPKLEEQLNRLGVWHLDQIAGWSEAEALWIDDHLEGFRGRILRDDWIGQARELTGQESA
ncbi:hypothetical protein [Limimaricola pyoseonensis]|uniref:Predicted 5' DNA nuclease, flap endonuclease-1-like, helix-3-turn-helix (H3TH) domain n=1 Tax=Limimaricola pyoseonensis TaxID=521013 RepID=A0A1G6ZF26_9RHOB|nr:hypothetical protein [Limimaricola pyoseonensis]SDE00817.1 Predicted 5' DNA nuclease, flap endonuclease-1-like, helix-3-turn-helix (H3TH) domain [Limimaricola pyoseonensis]